MEHSEEKKKVVLKRVLTGFIIVALIASWLFIVKYGIDLGKGYIDNALKAVENRSLENHQMLMDQNANLNQDIESLNSDINNLKAQIETVNEEIKLFSLEVRSLKSSIDIIDTSVSNSMVIQADLGNRILELDNRLVELRKSLNILLEAPNE